MRSPVRIASTIWFGVLVAVAAAGFAQRSGTSPAKSAGTPADATARIVAAAQALLTTLDDAGRAKVQFPFDAPQRTKWSNLPSPMFQRDGIRLADLTAPQRTAVDTLLSAALSRDGYRKVKEITLADGVLGRGQGAGRGRRPRGWRRSPVRRGRIFPLLPGNAVDDGAVDAAVRRSPPGDQPDDGGKPGEHGAEPPGRAAGNLRHSRAGRSVRSVTRTTRRLR